MTGGMGFFKRLSNQHGKDSERYDGKGVENVQKAPMNRGFLVGRWSRNPDSG